MNKPPNNSRRDFLKQSLAAGAALGGSLLLGGPQKLFGQDALRPELVAVKNGTPVTMFNKAISMMGGMQTFVKKGQTVVIKPNMGWVRTPETGANTNPDLVKAIVEHCLGAGAKKVYVFDNVAFSSAGMARQCYKESGIEDAAKSAGAIVAPGDSFKYYQEVPISGGEELASVKVHELILESDVFINVPILKSHNYTRLSVAMKNLMGAVWDRMEYHSRDLEQCIAEFCLFKKPDLNIVDAYRVMYRNGPQGSSPEDTVLKKTLLISQDIVAVDAAATKVFDSDLNPQKIRYIKLAHKMKLGNMNLEQLRIQRYVMPG